MMLSSNYFSATFDDLERKILGDIKLARSLTWPEPHQVRFSTSALSEAEINRLKATLPNSNRLEVKAKSIGYLYVFAQSHECKIRKCDILNAILTAKRGSNEENPVTNLCGINTHSSKGRVLYVGRSWDPKARVLGHLRASKGKTYALHFAAWAQCLDLKVDLFVYKFPGISDAVLQVLEDVTWDTLLPLFGRRGTK
jgi:hypothetical protein